MNYVATYRFNTYVHCSGYKWYKNVEPLALLLVQFQFYPQLFLDLDNLEDDVDREYATMFFSI